jgi:hypothetical protein
VAAWCRTTVDRSYFAEHGTRPQFGEKHSVAFGRIDDHAYLAGGEEEDLGRRIVITEYLLAGGVFLPLADPGELIQPPSWQDAQDRYPFGGSQATFSCIKRASAPRHTGRTAHIVSFSKIPAPTDSARQSVFPITANALPASGRVRRRR